LTSENTLDIADDACVAAVLAAADSCAGNTLAWGAAAGAGLGDAATSSSANEPVFS